MLKNRVYRNRQQTWTTLSACALMLVSCVGRICAQAPAEVPLSPAAAQAVQMIKAEALRSPLGEEGRPLPLASSWESGVGSWGLTGYPQYVPRPEKEGSLNLQAQLRLIEQGHHWLPVSPFPFVAATKVQHPEGSAWFNFEGHYTAWDTIATLGLPVTFVNTQFDAPLYNQSGTTDRWVKLPPSQNPNYLQAGKVYRRANLAAGAIATTKGSRTVRVTLPDASGLDTLPESRIWFIKPIAVGGLELSGERWQLLTVEGNEITFNHANEAAETATGGGVLFEVATVRSVADPMGPTGPWREAGVWWMTEYAGKDQAINGWKNLQQRYPTPSRLIFLSNNEGRVLRQYNVKESKRYMDAYGDKTDLKFAQQVLAKGIDERHEQMFSGMWSAMPLEWARVSKMVAYNEVVTFDGNIGYYQRSWEGASPEYYLAPYKPTSDFTVASPQAEYMNVKWQLELVYQDNPDFWYEMSVWDGKRAWYAEQNDPFTPERYKAWIQYGMWLTRPRVVREFRNTGETREATGVDYFNKFLEAVDDVYADPLKVRFWRKGTVVANTSRPSPYYKFKDEEYASIPKWFNLNTSLDRFPPAGQQVDMKTEMPVWALALVLGDAPKREWLVYAYSPKQNRTQVTISIPEYRDITLDVPQAGVFHHVVEGE